MSSPSPARSPLYEALNAPRYERQKLIHEYQETYSCRLVVMVDSIFPYNITPFEETLYDADPNQDLHVMFCTQGGDGETALRLVRQAQSRCKKLVVIVPDQAKSAGTLFALGADHIYMGPTSDLAGCGESDWVGRNASDGRRAEPGAGSPYPVGTGFASRR